MQGDTGRWDDTPSNIIQLAQKIYSTRKKIPPCEETDSIQSTPAIDISIHLIH